MTGAPSEKQFKAAEHRRERRNARMVVGVSTDDTDPRLFRSYGDPWAGPKDGKTWWHHDQDKAKRK